MNENQVIVVENLAVKNMVKNHCLAKAISDCGWSEFTGGDLIQAFSYNLEAGSNHFLFSGRTEGRQVTFNPLSYMSLNRDVAAAFNSNPILATEHYIQHGYAEGRRVA